MTTAKAAYNPLMGMLLWLQGGYYFVTGAWPLISIRTFKAATGQRGKTDHLVTGLENDHWLIMTVGALVTSIALSLLFGAYRKTQVPELAVLAIGAAVGLAAIDVIYVWREVIMPIYLVDAVAELLLILAWFIALNRN